jgi:hypothetical protein
MNEPRFDRWARALSDPASRRQTIVASLLGGLALLRGGDGAMAKKKRRKKKKIKRNAFGCVNVGKTCRNSGQCCSGICQGKKGKRKCRAHDVGTCAQDGSGVCTAPNPALLTCNNSDSCFCLRTTAGSSACAQQFVCADCQRDADCEALGFPPGSACAPVSSGNCAGACESGMACVVPCGFEPPVPE